MHINSVADALTVIGLALDAAGIVALFFLVPEKFPNPQWSIMFKAEDGSVEKWEKHQRIRRWIARVSLFVIVIGFVLQAIAVVVY